MTGTYLGFDSNLGVFKYRYTCPKCGKTFESSAPELSDPALCHQCYTGARRKQDCKTRSQKKRRLL